MVFKKIKFWQIFWKSLNVDASYISIYEMQENSGEGTPEWENGGKALWSKNA